MGRIIGQDPTGFLGTWHNLQTIAFVPLPPPTVVPPPILGDRNQEWPASIGYLRTIEGNGLIRRRDTSSGPGFLFIANDSDPPADDSFVALGSWVDPYPEVLVGRTVTTAGSSFLITADAFTGGQAAGRGGENPISVEWFEALT